MYVCMYIRMHTHTHTHIYIYIYMYVCMYIHTHTHTYIYIVCVCVCVFWLHFFINTNIVERNRYFLSIYFLVDPFILPYWFYSIRRELIYVFSIIVYFPSTFCPTLGHHHYNAPLWYKFHRTAFKKTFMPNKKMTKSYHRKHNNIRTSK